jgi:hypothetical protein
MWKRSDVPDAAVVAACWEWHYRGNGPARPCHYLMAWYPGLPLKVALAAMDRACDHGQVDYGVSLSTAWPEAQWVHQIRSLTC